MTEEAAIAKTMVLKRFPEAILVLDRWDPRYFNLYDAPHKDQDYYDHSVLLACSTSEEGAWIEAARRLEIEPPTTVDDRHIIVMRFEDAPQQYRDLSDPDDKDWLAFVPQHFADQWIGWMESGGEFGCYRVTEHPIKGGVIRIGANG